jgi:hypothetical protein
MAKTNSTRRVPRRSKPSWGEKLFKDFDAQPAQISAEQLDEMESTFTGNPSGLFRRTALASLARSGAELIEGVTRDRETALEFVRVQDGISDYAKRLRSFADIMDSASVRIGIALCSREDMQTLMEEAKATACGQEVGHG